MQKLRTLCEHAMAYDSTHVVNNVQKLFIQHFMFSTMRTYEQIRTLAILTTADL